MKITIETEKPPMTDLAKLELNFRDYVANLPDYKRTEVWAYVNALKAEIAKLEKENLSIASENNEAFRYEYSIGWDAGYEEGIRIRDDRSTDAPIHFQPDQ
jgi:hypothetical protein